MRSTLSRASKTIMDASLKAWGMTKDGRRVDAISLRNGQGLEVTLATYGATILSVKTPSKSSPAPEEVTLCYSNMEELSSKSPYYGCTVGRVANRIAKGEFSLGSKKYSLAVNNGANALHGGLIGFDKVIWEPRIYANEAAAGVAFTYTSHDGEEGYPGTLSVTADYAVTKENELTMTFSATTDKETPINICNHAYWNLSGGLSTNIKNHVLKLECPFYLPVNATQIPTGEIASVSGTAFDFFSSPATVGSRLADVDGGGQPGYDHCFCRSDKPLVPSSSAATPSSSSSSNSSAGASGAVASSPALALMGKIAELHDPVSGRSMTVSTTAPGVQLYCGNWLDKAAPHDQHRALCLETQAYPDSINQPHFPTAKVAPGETYVHKTIHKFAW